MEGGARGNLLGYSSPGNPETRRSDADQGDGIVKDVSVLAKGLKVRSASGRNASLSCSMQSVLKYKNTAFRVNTLHLSASVRNSCLGAGRHFNLER